LRCGWKTILLQEGDPVGYRESPILEGWYDVFIEDRYSGTIPEREFKREFRWINFENFG
jgi:hypothetical protein